MKKIFGEKGILSGKRVLAATLVIVLLSGITLYSVAAGHEWKSQGNVEAVRSDGTKTVIFDKSDLDYLDGRIDAIEADVSTGKENLANALNPLGTNPSLGTPLSGTSTFNELMEAINHSQAIPDKTIGESVSIATEDYELASKVTGQTINSDTKISAATADNLSLGTSAWVDGSLLIGTGADNKNYYESISGAKYVEVLSIVCVAALFNTDQFPEQNYNVLISRQIYDPNHIGDQKLLSASGYYSSGWRVSLSVSPKASYHNYGSGMLLNGASGNPVYRIVIATL